MKKYLVLLLFTLCFFSVAAQEFYWEYPEVLVPQNAYFPQVANNGEVMVVLWQEYSGDFQNYIIRGISSSDGNNWTEPQDLIGPIGFSTENPVSFFSLIVLSNDSFLLALPRSANSMLVYQSSDALNFQEQGEILSEKALLAPRLFQSGEGTPIAFMTQDIQGIETLAGGLTIFYSQLEGNRWTTPKELIANDKLSLNFLPNYHSFGGYEYVVFQSLYTGTRITWQLYMMRRPLGNISWEDPVLLTDFSDGNPERVPEFFFNQRPNLYDDGEKLYLSWERNYTLETPQVFTSELLDDGRINQDSLLQISSGQRFNAFPQLFDYQDQRYVLWFDNQQGNQIVLDKADQISYRPTLLSTISGESSYGQYQIFKDKLYFFWENKFRDQQRLVLLAPDHSVNPPRIRPVGFAREERKREMLANYTWEPTVDSSGIRGYRYSWNRDPVDNPTLGDSALQREPQLFTFTADEDGFWYFHLAAQDNAGNWSDAVHYPYNRDRTAPGQVEFIHPSTDEFGYLSSNSMQIAWRPLEDDDVAGYNYRLSYMGQDIGDPGRLVTLPPESRITQIQRAIRFNNRDNGFWRLSVIAIDNIGNVGKPSDFYFRLNKYIPVTYITWVTSERDEMDRILLNIRGRGFAAGGNIVRIILDKDGQEPYDYEYYLDQQFSVTSDRVISGPRIDFMEEGIYRIAVEHPQRGLAWGRNQLRLDSTGTVKYGNFDLQPSVIWQKIQDQALRLVLNDWTLYLILLFLTLILGIFLVKARQYYMEGAEIAVNSNALVQNTPIYSDLLLQEALQMKQKGLKLRAKFTLALLSLVIIIVMMVALFLGRYMITSQQLSLGEELEKRAVMLLDTLVNGGQVSLREQDRIQLRRLPDQTDAMEEALWTTIVGVGAIDPENYNYIWSSNDGDINRKQAPPMEIDSATMENWQQTLNKDQSYFEQWYEFRQSRWYLMESQIENTQNLSFELYDAGLLDEISTGQTPYVDDLSAALGELEDQVNLLAQQRIGDLKKQSQDLITQERQLILAGRIAESTEISNTRLLIDQQIEEILLQINNEIGAQVYPDFKPSELTKITQGNGLFIFYKPILYMDAENDRYYKGAVRLSISVDLLLQQLTRTRLTILRITAFAFVAALLLGLAGAFFLSTSMSRPIKELAKHVQIISETEDKKTLKNHIYPIKSGDEIGELGTIINNMTHGLVEAAKANEDLMAGKDIQKAFIPLELSPISGKKHTIGQFEDEDLLLFGYYEGAKTVSGDYFDFRQLDDEHFAIIKCDIAGKGVSASLIMVEVATIFVNYFRSHKPKEQGVDLADLVWTINDLLNEVGFAGRFAAFNIVLLNKRTGQSWMCHAGDREVNLFDATKGKMHTMMLNDVPAAGSIDSELLKMQGMGYIQTPHMLKHKDMIFLYTDGIEEAQNLFRNSDFKQITCDGSCGATENDPGNDKDNTTNHIMSETFEEFTTVRVFDVIEHVLDRKDYVMTKYHDPKGVDHKMNFNFSQGEATAEEAVLALIAAQFIFQLVPDPKASELDRVMIDRRVDDYLKKYFLQYRDYFKFPQENQENGEYIYYTHLKKDDQTDDLTILVVEKK
ncbi:MAG: SpoIIE family protein phosphatase [Spirochaetaceae bacterium]|jgi:HAMP domain-containing protein|nr:SpoIIE family protein phosphatase [Spirochaetaceae bacterium]